MAHRSFTDSLGRSWDVWTVVPANVERRLAQDGKWSGPERRHTQEFRVRLGRQWTNGWLAFETAGEKRRLAPIPDAWEDLRVDALESLLQRARRVPPSRRLVE